MLCEYGCGREANYQFKNNKWCCSKYPSSCTSVKAKINRNGQNNGMYGKKHSEETLNKIKNSVINTLSKKEVRDKIKKVNIGRIPWNKGKTGIYSEETKSKMGPKKRPPKYTTCIECGKKTKYSNYCKSCSVKKSKSEWPKEFNNNEKLLCTHGCGREAKYIFKNGKVSCSKGQQCPELKRKARIRVIKTQPHTYPSYNSKGCIMIDEYGKEYGYNFQHAMNGGEYYLKELGYWVDGYDKDKNIVIEIDEKHHFDLDGNLSEKDKRRQKEMMEHLGCEKFIRINYETGEVTEYKNPNLV